MVHETRITVPVDAVDWMVDRMVDAGVTVLDTGDRVTTEDGVGAEAVLHIADLNQEVTSEASIRQPPLSER